MTSYIYRTCLILSFVVFTACSGSHKVIVDPPLDAKAVRDLLDSGFIFYPQYVNPMYGRRRDLSSGFEVRVAKDTLVSYLPFFGRGYTAPISPSDVDFDFTSTHFSYLIASAKRGWTLSIKTTDQPSLREFYFRIFDNGGASLSVTSMDRSGIWYDGYITRRNRKGKK